MKKSYLFVLSLIIATPAFTQETKTNLSSEKAEVASSEIVAKPQRSPTPNQPTRRAAEGPADTSKDLGTQPDEAMRKSTTPQQPAKRAAEAPTDTSKELGTQPTEAVTPKSAPRPQEPARPASPSTAPRK